MRHVVSWLIGGLVLAATGEASAFECSRSDTFCQVSVHWTIRTIPYVLRRPDNSGFDELQATGAVEQAMARWENVACSDIRFDRRSILSLTASSPVTNDVTFIADNWEFDEEGELRNDPAAAGVTRVVYSVSTGVAQSAVLEINEAVTAVTDPATCAGVFDLETVVTHEIGHYLGIAHPCEFAFTGNPDRPCPVVDCETIVDQFNDEEPFPTMWPVVEPCDTQLRSLESDDTDALCFVYPRASTTQQCYEIPVDTEAPLVKNSAFGCTTTGGGELGWWWMLALVVWRRARAV